MRCAPSCFVHRVVCVNPPCAWRKGVASNFLRGVPGAEQAGTNEDMWCDVNLRREIDDASSCLRLETFSCVARTPGTVQRLKSVCLAFLL